MKKYILTLVILVISLFTVDGQIDAGFTTVPVVNGKVVFEQYILADQGVGTDQKYALLQKWGKQKFTGNPMLSGIRFDDKTRSVTVSTRDELILPENSVGVNEKIIMSYRFDASITNAGCMLVVRDITYQITQKDAASFFPKVYTAEQTITDQAANATGEEGIRRNAIRNETLSVLNNLYAEISAIF
ncbi:MAG: hypothetical protein ITG04_11745 [Proteiniphilum sp.]|nr:hypothetical protein [Proteiniphilum sp.]